MVEDGKDDLVEFSLAEFMVYRERGKEHLDISRVESYLENDTVHVEFNVHGRIKESNLVDYEVLITLHDVSYRYGESDVVLLYSDGKATMTFMDNYTHIDLTNDTTVLNGTIVFRLERIYFDDAVLFDIDARAKENSFDDLGFYMDSTYSIEQIAEERPSEYYVYYVLAVIGLVILALVILSSSWKRIGPFRRRRSTLCSRCNGLIRDGDRFCYHCGEVMTEGTIKRG